MSRHSGGTRPPDDEHAESARSVSARKPRRKRVVLNDSRNPVTVVRVMTELEEQTSVGEALVRNLVRAQLKMALWLALVLAVIFGSLPLAFYLSPTFANTSVFGVRLPWLILGVLPFPILFAIGLLYNRLAERHEKDFVNMVES
jgi:fatty acid desaturase